MENIYFRIERVTRMIERQNAVNWRKEQLYYENEYALVFILDGTAAFTLNGQTYLAKKDDLILFPPKCTRSGRTGSEHPLSFITVLFRMELNEPAQILLQNPIHIWNNPAGSCRTLFTELYRTWISKAPLYAVKCGMLVTEILYNRLLSDLPYRNTPHIEKLEKARTLIHENFKDDLSVEFLADSAGMSASYFRRLFSEVYGCSPMQYTINLRIENARDLLLSREVNITEAAQLSGFHDVYYFSRLFKKKTGFPPSQLLKRIAGPNTQQ